MKVRLVLACVLLAACGQAAPTTAPPGYPTDGEARSYLGTVVAMIRRGDLSNVCELGSGTCSHTLGGVDPATVPLTDPIVYGSSLLETATLADGTRQVGGRVLELCGRDGLGKAYFSELLVFRGQNGLLGKEPLFWIGLRIARSNVTETPAPTPSTCPPPSG